jgi:adenosylcobinamide-phosphate synthase
MSLSVASAVGLALGYLADLALGDPRRGHPVAGFGRVAGWLEGRLYADRRFAGAEEMALLVGGAAALGVALDRLTAPSRRREGGSARDTPTASGGNLLLVLDRAGAARAAVTALGTWAVLGGRSLRREALIIAGHLEGGDLAAARRRLPHLVGRDPAHLGVDEIARAVVESLAENTSDAVVAPLLWGAVTGLPGLLGYRAANTLDAMIGHRSPRYRRYGWAAARLDDVVNWLPARAAALLAAALAPALGGSAREAVRAATQDTRRHPSPNACVVEAAFAGGLGVRLGGVNVYAGQVEDRGVLGRGRAIRADDIGRAARLSALVSAAAAVAAVALRLLIGRRR